MLANLKIENVAVIEKAEVRFTPGFNVLTGETGAGKSILIDSINAILGSRTSRELVRSGAQKACIWATFENIPGTVKQQLEKCGYEAADDLLLYREINAEGKGSCRVNGMPATAAVVRDISAGLLSIHGQHDSQGLTNPALHLGLLDQYAQNRELREKLLMGYYMRGNNNNANDNKKIVSRMSNLRLQKAKLLGFDTYADYVIDVNMAKTSKAVFDFLGRVWEPALKVAKQELAEMQAIADKEGLGDKLQCWDWWYYAEKLRKQKYDLDENEMKPYLSLENVREGMFHVANKLYGITLQQRTDVPVYYPGVEVYEVKETDGSSLGLLYMDYFTRASKSGGAWMTEFRSYTEKDGKVELPLVSLVYNISPAAKGEPVLLSWDNTETMFHEFGHALHGFFTRGKYHRIAGTIPRDMVELPSQVMENWASEPEVLKMYAKHYQTGETMPDELIAKIQESGHFNQGFATVEYIAASLLDMEWNSITTEGDQDVEAFEKAAMDKYGLIPEIKPRYRTTYFSHVFDGGYAAGYYVYLWAEVLDADTFNAFKASGDIYNQELATKFRKYVLSEGGYADPMSQYIKFRGETPTEDALLQKRGLK